MMIDPHERDRLLGALGRARRAIRQLDNGLARARQLLHSHDTLSERDVLAIRSIVEIASEFTTQADAAQARVAVARSDDPQTVAAKGVDLI